MLAANNIHVSVGTKTLLHIPFLEAQPGQMIGIVGPNGAGKSTLLHTLAGSMRPQSGEILLHNKPLHHYTEKQLAAMRAVLTQHQSLHIPMPALDVVRTGRYPFGNGHQPADERIIQQAMQQMHVQHLQHRAMHTLSGGEQQRVHLARVLAQLAHHSEPRILLLDEPTTGLDMEHQYTLAQTAQTFANQGNVVITILHDLNLAAQFCHQIWVLQQGTCRYQGTPQEVLTPQIISEVFNIQAYIWATHPHPHIHIGQAPRVQSREMAS